MKRKLILPLLFSVAASTSLQVDRYAVMEWSKTRAGSTNVLEYFRPGHTIITADANMWVIDTAVYEIYRKELKSDSIQWYYCTDGHNAPCKLTFHRRAGYQYYATLWIEWRDSIRAYKLNKY